MSVHGSLSRHCSTGTKSVGVLANLPTATVGTGTAASCTFDALRTAAAAGGVITFDCGDAPLTIPVTATLELPIDEHTVIDGGNKITLDGGGAVRILSGGGVFFTSNNRQGVLTIADSMIAGNTGGHWTNVETGSVDDAGTAVGTNARSITITNSTVQGVP